MFRGLRVKGYRFGGEGAGCAEGAVGHAALRFRDVNG